MKKLLGNALVLRLVLPSILILVMTTILFRPVLVLYHQQQAGKIIDQVALNMEGSDLISYCCFLGQFLDDPPSELDEAINHLLKAKGLKNQNTRTAYLYG